MKVWVLMFDGDCSDCNGVYSTELKAIEAFNTHLKRCSNIWKNVKTESQGRGWAVMTFDLIHPELETKKVTVVIEEHEVNAI